MSQKVLGTAVYPIEINDEYTVTAPIAVLADDSNTLDFDVDGVNPSDFVDISVLVYNAGGGSPTWDDLPAKALVQGRVTAVGSVRATFSDVGGAGYTVTADSKIFVKVRVRANGAPPEFP